MNSPITTDTAARTGRRAFAALGVTLISALALAGCGGADEAHNGGAPSQDGAATEGPTDDGAGADDPAAGGQDDLAAEDFDVTWQDAVSAAQASFDGRLLKVELDRERSGFAYTIELASDTEEYEAKIDPSSGEILHEESEPLEADDAAEIAEEVIGPKGLIAPAEAMSAATAEIDGPVASWSLDRSWDGTFYEVEIRTGDDRDVVIDASDGTVAELDD